MDRKNDPGPPPGRFAALFRDAGLTSPEVLRRAFRISSGQAAPSVAASEKAARAGKDAWSAFYRRPPESGSFLRRRGR